MAPINMQQDSTSILSPSLKTQEPSQLQKLFEKNYDLLLSIFNPQVI